jgi:maleate isomerase
VKRVAILTPMENPTVEAEMRHLLPVDFVVARLVSTAEESERRLVDYAERAAEVVGQFGEMKVTAIGFACTASSYLIGRDREEEIATAFPLPFLFAAAAIRQRLAAQQAGRIAIISPYPQPLHQAGLRYWQGAGLEIAYEARIDIGSTDTRAIYRLDGGEAEASIEEAKRQAPDAILLAGTGMPTLRLIDPEGDPPILSSNLCLAASLAAAVETSRVH